MWSRWMILRIFVPFICSQAESKGVVDGVVDVCPVTNLQSINVHFFINF